MAVIPPGSIVRTDNDVDMTGIVRVYGGSKFLIVDQTDSTKSVIFNLSSLPTATQTEFTIPDSDSSIVTLSATQTLTNKTLTAPVITGATIGVVDSGFTITDDATPSKVAKFQCSGISSSTTRTFTFPDVDDTLVTLGATQTLTDKTLTNPTINAGSGVVVLPAATSPAQTAEGSIVWDSDDDLLTVGDGSSRKIMVDTSATQTLSGKTLTNPTVNAGSGVVVLPINASPAQTANGSVVWDSDDFLLTVGDGSARKVMVDTTTAQTLTNKTLTTPALNGGTWVATDSTFTIADNGTPSKLAAFQCSTISDSTTRTFTFPDANGTLSLVAGTETLTNKTLTSPVINTPTINRTAQVYFCTAPGSAKVGATAGWVVAATTNTSRVTLPAGVTAGTLVLPIVAGLKVGWTITGFYLVGQIESAGNTATLDANMFKLTAAAADLADASIGAITQISVTADTEISAANSTKTLDTPEVIAANESFYVLITGTTAADTDVDLMGVAVIVTEV